MKQPIWTTVMENTYTQVFLAISSDIKANYKTAQEYRKLNSNIDITYVSNCKLYPQLENPEKVYQIIENKLSN